MAVQEKWYIVYRQFCNLAPRGGGRFVVQSGSLSYGRCCSNVVVSKYFSLRLRLMTTSLRRSCEPFNSEHPRGASKRARVLKWAEMLWLIFSSSSGREGRVSVASMVERARPSMVDGSAGPLRTSLIFLFAKGIVVYA